MSEIVYYETQIRPNKNFQIISRIWIGEGVWHECKISITGRREITGSNCIYKYFKRHEYTAEMTSSIWIRTIHCAIGTNMINHSKSIKVFLDKLVNKILLMITKLKGKKKKFHTVCLINWFIYWQLSIALSINRHSNNGRGHWEILHAPQKKRDEKLHSKLQISLEHYIED